MPAPTGQTLWCRPPGSRSTRIEIGRGLLASVGELLEQTVDGAPPSARFWLWDRAVKDALQLVVPPASPSMAVDAGENLKTLAGAETVLRAMAQHDLDRGAELVAVGGGTVGDLGGLVGSLYLRGIAVVQVPTTLLAMIDSSVGGKTAVNLPEGKNLVGTVHPPRLVVADMGALATLPEREFRSGLGEALKMAIGVDRELFELMESERPGIMSREASPLTEMVRRAIRAKIEVVEGDLRESGHRRVLNLGHTWGHALEIHSGFRIPHGVAVARGLHVVLDLAVARGHLDIAAHRRCSALLEAYGFAADPIPDNRTLAPFLRRDKKVRGDALHVVLPTAVGACTVEAIALAELL